VLTPYRDLFAIDGAVRLTAAGLVMRMPVSMHRLGVVLLVAGATGSYGVAGSVAACFTVAQALLAPPFGRLIDRHGQSRVVPLAVAVHTGALLGLIVCVVSEAPQWLLLVTAAVAGGAFVPGGSLVRARWSHLVGGTRRLETAFSSTTVGDEILWVTGPLLVTALATSVDRTAGLLTSLAFLVAGTVFLQTHRASEPPPRERGRGARSAIRQPGMRMLVAVWAAVGLSFGALEVTMVAFADEEGHRGAAGAMLSVWSAGSLLAAFFYGLIAWRAPLERRLVVALVAMSLTMVPTVVAGSLPAVMAIAFATGIATAPVLISGPALAERLVERGSLTEALAWMSTGLGLGLSLGAAIAGRAVDALGAESAFAVAVACGAAPALAALAGAGRLRPAPEAALGSRG
jgi:MFS family permease